MTPLLSTILAEASVGFPNWIGELAFGSVVVLALFGYIWFKPAVDRLQADKTRAEEQRDALIEVYQAEIIPLLGDVARGQVAVVQTMTDEVVPLLAEVKTLLLARRSP